MSSTQPGGGHSLSIAEPKAKRRFALNSKTLRLVVSAALLAYLAWKTEWDKVGAAFTRLEVGWWLVAVAVLAVTQVVSAVRWALMARPLGFDRPLRQMVGFYYIGMYFSLVLPTSVGGDVVRAWYLGARPGQRLNAFYSVLLDRLSGLLMLLVLACGGVLLSPLALPSWVCWSVWGAAICGAAGFAMAPLLARHRLAPARLKSGLDALAAVSSPGVLATTTGLSLVVQAANVLVVYLVGRSIGAEVPGAYYWVLVPMVSLLTLLPVSIAGIGVREQAMVAFLAPLAVPAETALPLSILWFAVSLAVGLLGGVVYLFGHFPSPATAGEERSKHGRVDRDSDQGREGQPAAAA